MLRHLVELGTWTSNNAGDHYCFVDLVVIHRITSWLGAQTLEPDGLHLNISSAF